MIIDLEEVKEELRKRLSEKRYNHSLGTMKKAKELANIFGEDKEKAEFAGLIHDIAKEMTKEEIEKFLENHDIEFDEIEKENKSLLHSKLGSIIAKEEFGADEKIQNAIAYHTTGHRKMDTFAKIIYVADKIEENRNYDRIDELRELAMKNLDEAILFILDFTIQKNITKGTLIHPDTIDLRNDLILKNTKKCI